MLPRRSGGPKAVQMCQKCGSKAHPKALWSSGRMLTRRLAARQQASLAKNAKLVNDVDACHFTHNHATAIASQQAHGLFEQAARVRQIPLQSIQSAHGCQRFAPGAPEATLPSAFAGLKVTLSSHP